MKNVILSLFFCCALCGQSFAQSFHLNSNTDPKPEKNADRPVFFTVAPPAKKLSFVFIPPAKKMFIDLTGNKILFPPLFPEARFFNEVSTPPPFFYGRFKGDFRVYEINGYYLGINKEYSLYSATIKRNRLFIMTKDEDDDFVTLDQSHFAIFRKDGTPINAEEEKHTKKNVSVLVDRSGSMNGFDADVSAAITELSQTLVRDDFCALYEFGRWTKVIRPPSTEICGTVFSNYVFSAPDGNTPLFNTLERAYEDVKSIDSIVAVVVVSDGEPTDKPSASLAALSQDIPTFVIWVGNHTTNYLAVYSTSHAIAKSGVESAVRDFLRGISFSVKGHQTFILSP